MQAGLEGLQRRNVLAAKNSRGVGALHQRVQVLHVVHELAQDGLGELDVRQAAPALEIGPGEALGHVQAAIGGEALEQDVGKALRLAAAPGADVEHYLPCFFCSSLNFRICSGLGLLCPLATGIFFGGGAFFSCAAAGVTATASARRSAFTAATPALAARCCRAPWAGPRSCASPGSRRARAPGA